MSQEKPLTQQDQTSPNRVYTSLQWVLWGLLVFSLPITSFPLITRLAGGTMVGPAAMIPLLGLLLVWWIPSLWKQGKLPMQAIPLLAFGLFAILSSLLSFYIQIPAFQTAAVWRQVAEGLVTLMIGLAFYVITATWPANEDRLQRTLRWINWSGLVILIWAIIQGIAWEMFTHWPDWIRSTQKLISSGTLFRGRVVGFTFEPSWLAHQLNMLYLPIWMAASFLRKTVHKVKFLGFSLENLLLAGGIVMLYISKSRLGLLAFILCIAFLLFELSLKIVSWLRSKVRKETTKRWATVLFYTGLVVVTITLLVGTGFYLSKADPRMQEFFNLQTLSEKSFLEYAEQLAFSARIVYWQAGWEIFGERPILGVGLGNAGYYFYDKFNPYAWELIEVRNNVYNFSSPPNIKSLWMRLLAETGIIGFLLWITWLVLILLTAIVLRRRKDTLSRILGLAGVLTLLAFFIDGFSLDTFALPYFWVTFGLVTAAFTASVSSQA